MPTTSNSYTPKLSARIPELDGLRGFAILIVVLLHYGYYPGTPGPPLLVHIRNLFSLGWTGVDLFFVLSGFLIGGILLDAKASTNYFKTFYVRRFYRIIPIYYVWILCFIVLLVFGGKILRAHTHSGVLPSLGFGIFEHFLFLQNALRPQYVTLAYWWFGVTWSLAVEEQFYIVAPLLIKFLNVARLRTLLVTIIFAAPLLRAYFYLTERPLAHDAFSLMPCRADSLAFGMLAAICWRDERFRARLSTSRTSLTILLAVLFAGMVVLWRWFPNPLEAVTLTIGLSWIALFYVSVLVSALLNTSGLVARFTRLLPLRELGRVSYCVYLIHFAVSYLVFGFLTRSVPHLSDLRSLGLTLLSALVTYLAAELSWNYFESPLVRIGHQTRYATIPFGDSTPLKQLDTTSVCEPNH